MKNKTVCVITPAVHKKGGEMTKNEMDACVTEHGLIAVYAEDMQKLSQVPGISHLPSWGSFHDTLSRIDHCDFVVVDLTPEDSGFLVPYVPWLLAYAYCKQKPCFAYVDLSPEGSVVSNIVAIRDRDAALHYSLTNRRVSCGGRANTNGYRAMGLGRCIGEAKTHYSNIEQRAKEPVRF